MQTSEIVIFGKESSVVKNVAKEIKDICETSGIEYQGPHTPPPIDLDSRKADITDSDVILFGKEPTRREISSLENETVYVRRFEIHRYSSDDVMKDIVKNDYPDEVFLRVSVRQSEFIGADDGNVPFGYDPNADNVPK